MSAVTNLVRTDPDAVWTEVLPLWHAAQGRVDEHADVGFYMRHAATATRPVVELGIGYGRIARWIRPDYGVDPSRAALASCAERVPDTTLIEARGQEYDLPEPAGLSYAPQNLLSLLGGPAQVVELLATVRRNTRPGGRLVFDAAVADWDRIRSRLDRELVHGQVGTMRLSYRAELVDFDGRGEEGALLMHHVMERIDLSGEVCSRIHYPPVSVHYFSPRRFRELLAWAGWNVEQCWGGLAGEPLSASSRVQVWLVSR